jgi:hypothetical protein
MNIQGRTNHIDHLERVGMSRRGFLHGMGGAAALLGMAGLAGIVAHQSALKNGELLKIPQFAM